MPALQVRDFPDDLYTQLKTSAQRNHRSMAQQVIAYVEQGMRAESDEQGGLGAARRPAKMYDFDTLVERERRIQKRKALFKEIEALPWKGDKPSAEDVVAMIRQDREERDNRVLEACGFFEERAAREEGR